MRAVARAIERLGLAKLLASRPSLERSIILALIAQRVLSPASKLGCTRKWHETSLADEFGVNDVRVDQVFDAMDWLTARQEQVEERLAARHLSSTTPLLFDLSSSYVEGARPNRSTRARNDSSRRNPILISSRSAAESRRGERFTGVAARCRCVPNWR